MGKRKSAPRDGYFIKRVPISAKLHPDTLKALDAIAARHEISRAYAIELLIKKCEAAGGEL